MIVPTVISVICAYLIGSIPFGYLAGLSQGVDIRTVGSGNIGATNVFRVLGKKFGIGTFVLDVFKGIAATCVVSQSIWVAFGIDTPAPLTAEMLCAVAVLMGHSFPIFLGFKGGKGVATGLGIAIGVAPCSALIAFAVWIVLFVSTRYVSVGSIGAALVVGTVVWFVDNVREPRHLVPAIITLLAVLIIVKHRTNISRLIQGNENRFDFGKKKKQS